MSTRNTPRTSGKRTQRHDRRPSEVVVENTTDSVVFIGDPALNGPNPLDNLAYVVDPGVPTILPRRVFASRRDGHTLRKSGALRLSDDTTGKVADVVNISDNRARALARDGESPPPSRDELRSHWRGVLLDFSLADVVVDCLLAGLPEEPTVGELVRVYDQSFLSQTASSQPWIQRSRELIALHGPKQVTEVQPAKEGGE